MGVYYQVCCDDAKQYIDLDDFGRHGNKREQIMPAVAGAVALTMCYQSAWYRKAFRVVSDLGGDFVSEDDGWENVSEFAFEEADRQMLLPLEWHRGDPDDV